MVLLQNTSPTPIRDRTQRRAVNWAGPAANGLCSGLYEIVENPKKITSTGEISSYPFIIKGMMVLLQNMSPAPIRDHTQRQAVNWARPAANGLYSGLYETVENPK
jgi:hypothetical protein